MTPRDAGRDQAAAPEEWPDFEVTVESQPHGLCVQVAGDLDTTTAPKLIEALDRLLDQGHSLASLDLDQVAFMDGRGLAAVIRAQQAAARQGRQLTIRCTAAQVRRLFDLTRLVEHVAFE